MMIEYTTLIKLHSKNEITRCSCDHPPDYSGQVGRVEEIIYVTVVMMLFYIGPVINSFIKYIYVHITEF